MATLTNIAGADPGFVEKDFYKGVGVRFADFISFFLKYSMKMKSFGLTGTKLKYPVKMK